ncbi:MAG: hypothetical protein AAF378_17945 [Cyanobacteria bacterium P01_A01_bin.84]
MELKLIVPYHLRLFKYDKSEWTLISSAEILLQDSPLYPDPNDLKTIFGISPYGVVRKFIKRFGEKEGFYLADFECDRYYY